jgi:hypothetical protein
MSSKALKVRKPIEYETNISEDVFRIEVNMPYGITIGTEEQIIFSGDI